MRHTGLYASCAGVRQCCHEREGLTHSAVISANPTSPHWSSQQVLGISGVVGGLVKGKASEFPRWLFFAGLLTGGMALKTLYPAGIMRTHAHTLVLAGLDTPQSIVRMHAHGP